MNANPLITVITVTYNASESIAATMESVRTQQSEDYEHIIVDGASTDTTIDIVRRYDNPRLKIISEPDNGLYDAMNKGLRMARGKYVIFLNAGDRFATAATLSRYSLAAGNDADIIYGDTMIVDAKGNLLRPRHLSVPRELSAKSFAKGMLVCHQAFMVKRELAPQYDLNYRWSADYDWCIRCLKAHDNLKCVNLRCVTIHFLEGGLTRKHKIDSLRERFRIMCSHYGCVSTICHHAGFLFRALARRMKKAS